VSAANDDRPADPRGINRIHIESAETGSHKNPSLACFDLPI
jgi:hypothetical protein